METTIPFTKDILFKSKIAQITSISLEHELNINDDSVSGNFIVSGGYKTHEVCINQEDFEYKLPFSVEITTDIDTSTLKFEIIDFNYEIIGDDVLRVNIEFIVNADKRVIQQELDEDRTQNLFEEPEKKIIETSVEIHTTNEVEQRLDKEDEQTILDSTDNKDEEFMIYNIHIVRQNETLENISQSYNTTIELLKEYNNIEELNIGDKLLIPQLEDE